MKDTRYVVVNERIGCDIEQIVFRTPDEANDHAKMLWDHLTRSERRRSHIAAYIQTEDMIAPEDIEEWGLDRAWGMGDMDGFPGAFDSDALED